MQISLKYLGSIELSCTPYIHGKQTSSVQHFLKVRIASDFEKCAFESSKTVWWNWL